MKTPLHRAFTVLAVLVLIVAAAAIGAVTAPHSHPLDCRPVDYVHGAWLNPAGQTVAVAPTEDSVLHYIGECA